MTSRPVKVLVLAGTAEARAVIDGLMSSDRFDLTASLAGATQNPAPLPVPTVSGGFGGVEGLAGFCREHAIQLLVDVTHPFARQISRNARDAARDAGIMLLRYDRPPWQPQDGDDWQSFNSWQEMADAIAPASRVFLAGGTQSIDIFTRRHDIQLWARALNVAGRSGPDNVTFINAMPGSSVAEEMALFTEAGVTLLCCKNSGGMPALRKSRRRGSWGSRSGFLPGGRAMQQVKLTRNQWKNSRFMTVLKRSFWRRSTSRPHTPIADPDPSLRVCRRAVRGRYR